MIIHNSTLYSKRLKIFLIIFETIIIISSFILLLISAIGQSLDETSKYYVASSIIWALGIVSFVDLISYISSRRFVSLCIYVIIRNKLKLKKIKPTSKQQTVLNNFFANTEDSIKCVTVLVNGLKGSGKSECTDYIIENALTKITNDKRKIKSEFYFIDCYNDSENTSNFINDELMSANLNNNIIIIDNCNEADGSIVSKLKELNEFHNCSILIIEENSEFFKNKLGNLTNNKIIEISFDDILNLNGHSRLKAFIKKHGFSALYAKILIACAIYCRYFNIFSWKQIKKVLNLSFQESCIGYLFIKCLIAAGIIKYFPLNSSYIRFKFIEDIDYIITEYRKTNETLFEDVLNKLNTSELFQKPEIHWQFIFELPFKTVMCIEQNDRIKLFKNAVLNGNYQKLYNVLYNFIQNNNCEDEFRYELGYLYYNLGKFKDAFKQYKLIKNIDKDELNIRLIESMHGSNDEQIKKQVMQYIKELKTLEGPAKSYGFYWEYHIESEKGNFEIKNLDNLRVKLMLQYKEKPDFLLGSILERSFTDEIRMYWLQGNMTERINMKLKEDYLIAFKNKPNCTYYNNLYFLAGFYHYFFIPNKIWLTDDLTLLNKFITSTMDYYKDAIFCAYNKVKSKKAAEVKLADFATFTMDCDYDKQIKIVEKFKSSSEKQSIDVFVAYSDCLLAKMKILKYMLNENLYLSNDVNKQIIMHIETSRKIYENYGNKYGVLRCDFITILFDLLKNFSVENDAAFNSTKSKMVLYSQNCYPLEKNFINKLLLYKKDNYLTIYNSLKFYPIILQ